MIIRNLIPVKKNYIVFWSYFLNLFVLVQVIYFIFGYRKNFHTLLSPYFESELSSLLIKVPMVGLLNNLNMDLPTSLHYLDLKIFQLYYLC